MIEILIVEDESAISDLLKLNLTKVGYACICAYDGLEAADTDRYVYSSDGEEAAIGDSLFDLIYLKQHEIEKQPIHTTDLGNINYFVSGIKSGGILIKR